MSGDLISRSAVIQLIENCHVLEDAYCLVDYVNELDASYDAEKVIQQLEENKESVIKTIENLYRKLATLEMADPLKELIEEYTRQQIEIVKSGGTAVGQKGDCE